MAKSWTEGGDTSIFTPLDEEVVNNPALLMAVTVTKYVWPCLSSTSTSARKSNPTAVLFRTLHEANEEKHT